jgi:outer membrane receptor for ferrienterochelin and colicin
VRRGALQEINWHRIATRLALALAGALPASGAAPAPPAPADPPAADVPAAPSAASTQPPAPAPDTALEEIISRVATRTDRPLSLAPASVTVLRGDQLEDLGVRFLTDALRAVPGLEVVRISSTESNVAARGFNDDSSASQGILGLLDGRQVYNEFFGGVVWESIPVVLDDIERIEVIRGPGSFIHGPNAMHGLVSIVTKSPLDYPRDLVHAEASCGSYRSHVESLTVVHRREVDGFKVKLFRDDLNEFEPAGENAKDKLAGEFRYATQLGRKDHQLDVSAGFSEQKLNVLLPTFAGLPGVTLATEILDGFVRTQYTLDHFKAQGSWTHSTCEIRPAAIYPAFDLALDTVDLDLQHTVSLAEIHAVTAGTGYRLAAFETNDQDVSDGRHHTGLAWAFAQDEWTAVPNRLWVTAGVRYDHHSVSGGNVSPHLAAVWKLAAEREQYLRAGAGYGYRNPSLRELWMDMPLDVPGLPASPVIAGNKRLDAEQLRSFEIGYAGRWGSPHAHTRVDAVAYYNLFDRGIDYRPVDYFSSPPFPSGTPSRFEPVNSAKDEAYGVEIEVRRAFSDAASAFANYSFAVRQDRDTHARNPLTPNHKANAGLRVVPLPNLTVSTWATFFDDTTGYDPAGAGRLVDRTTSEYVLLNLRLAYTFRWGDADWTAYLQAFNLLDHDHREHPEGDPYGLILMGGIAIRW